MNVSSPRDRSSSVRRPSLLRPLLRRIAPVALAILVALPTAASARVYWSVNVGPGYPAYRVYRPYGYRPYGYRPYAYRAYAVYPAYPVYPYPVYPAYSYEPYPAEQAYAPAERVYTHRYVHRHPVATASVAAVATPPPPLPEYNQPPMPGDGYIWTPGYWNYASDDYFWVPGTWVLAPYPGALWTPPYWASNDGYYAFHPGYWGLQVGYYGGIDYGFGYFGVGYFGGHWHDGVFVYNRAVNNIGTLHLRNSYNVAAVNVLGRLGTRTSFTGGAGGTHAQPTAADRTASRESHMPPLAEQQRQVQMASRDRAMFASVNHGSPSIAATARAGVFNGSGVAEARNPGPQSLAGQTHAGQNGRVGAIGQSAMSRRGDERFESGRPGYADSARERFGPARVWRGYPMEGWGGRPQAGQEHGRVYADRSMDQPNNPRHGSDAEGHDKRNPR
jgi:hypothetical protein